MKIRLMGGSDADVVEFIDDYGDGLTGKLFLIGNEFGWTHLVGADSMDSAEEAWLDQQTTIDPEDVWEAYGFDSFAEFKQWNEEPGAEDRDLVEGYRYQGTFTGTGIVNVGHYHRIIEVHLAEGILSTGPARRDDDVKRVAAMDELIRTLRDVHVDQLAKVVAAGRRAMLQEKHGHS